MLDETSFDKGDKRSFNAIFGGNPFNSQNEGVGNNDFKFGDILTDGPGSDKAGVNNVNLGLVLIYLNALGNGSNGIVYPVLSQHNDNEAQFASYLYANALSGPSNVGGLLMSTVSKYSNGNGCI